MKLKTYRDAYISAKLWGEGKFITKAYNWFIKPSD